MFGRIVLIIWLLALAAWISSRGPSGPPVAPKNAEYNTELGSLEKHYASSMAAELSLKVKPKNASEGGMPNVPTNWKSITTGELQTLCQPLRSADSTTRENFEKKIFGKFVDQYGVERLFNPGSILLRLKGEDEPSLLEVTPGTELSALGDLQGRIDVAYAELDALMTRQFIPNDERLANQWHHNVIASSNAWHIRMDAPDVRIAIVDTPFQMNHPDLAANTVAGWDLVNKREVIADNKGFFHSTIGAGMAAAVVNNGNGVAGAANAKILPVNINGYLSELAQAIQWCGDNGIRVVNLSWDGAYSSTLNDAAAIHRAKTDGVVVMSGVNSRRFLDYPNQPFLLAISMTDSLDLSRSAYGRHIDFAAPGWAVFSTTTNSFYESDSGSSYSAPLASGMIAALMGINPDLRAAEIETILSLSSVDLGPESWDQYYGWGRIDFGKAALMAVTSLKVRAMGKECVVTVPYYPTVQYQFYRAVEVGGQWQLYESETQTVATGKILLQVPLVPENIFLRALGRLKE